MNTAVTTCKICGNTDSMIWHSFIHQPVLRLAPEGILYRGIVFHLCDRCMAEMMDTALSIRRAKDRMFMERTDPPDFHHSVIKPKEDTGDEM